MNRWFAPDSHLLPLMTVLCDLSLLWTMTYIFQYACRVIEAHGVYAAKTFFLVWKHSLSSIICPTACKTPDYGSSKKYKKCSWPIDFSGVDLFQCNVPTVLLIFRKWHKNIPRLLVSSKRTGVLLWSKEEFVALSRSKFHHPWILFVMFWICHCISLTLCCPPALQANSSSVTTGCDAGTYLPAKKMVSR